jgi:hypothetical protein
MDLGCRYGVGIVPLTVFMAVAGCTVRADRTSTCHEQPMQTQRLTNMNCKGGDKAITGPPQAQPSLEGCLLKNRRDVCQL